MWQNVQIVETLNRDAVCDSSITPAFIDRRTLSKENPKKNKTIVSNVHAGLVLEGIHWWKRENLFISRRPIGLTL